MLVCLFKTDAVKSYEMFLFCYCISLSTFSLIFKSNTCSFLSDVPFLCFISSLERELSYFSFFGNKMRS